jgi:hypothetical protein
VIQTNTIERVEECEAALNFMSFDHCLEDLMNCEWFPFPSKVIGNGQDGTQVVRRMTPLM